VTVRRWAPCEKCGQSIRTQAVHEVICLKCRPKDLDTRRAWRKCIRCEKLVRTRLINHVLCPDHRPHAYGIKRDKPDRPTSLEQVLDEMVRREVAMPWERHG